MLSVLILAAASFLTSPVEEIVLRSGQVIAVEELVRVERGRLIFATGGDNLYSIRLSEVDIEKTDARLPANRAPSSDPSTRSSAVAGATNLPRDLPVSEEEKMRILAEMETRSHTGRARERSAEPVDEMTQPESPSEDEGDEWMWREEARRHREAIEQAKERLASARQRERELNDMLLLYVGTSGDASNYSYLVMQLADLRSMIPQFEGDLRRAESAWAQFQDDARRRGILPGWLR